MYVASDSWNSIFLRCLLQKYILYTSYIYIYIARQNNIYLPFPSPTSCTCSSLSETELQRPKPSDFISCPLLEQKITCSLKKLLIVTYMQNTKSNETLWEQMLCNFVLYRLLRWSKIMKHPYRRRAL